MVEKMILSNIRNYKEKMIKEKFILQDIFNHIQ